VTKLDRLGGDVIDVVSTLNRLAEMGVRVHCLQVGDTDLTSAAGKMTMDVLVAVAQFERDLLIERTRVGLRRASAAGTKSGRKPALTELQRAAILAAIESGTGISGLVRAYDTSQQTSTRTRIEKAEAR
jgi:putative DNA-invertase from lambdoid prophage Rac